VDTVTWSKAPAAEAPLFRLTHLALRLDRRQDISLLRQILTAASGTLTTLDLGAVTRKLLDANLELLSFVAPQVTTLTLGLHMCALKHLPSLPAFLRSFTALKALQLDDIPIRDLSAVLSHLNCQLVVLTVTYLPTYHEEQYEVAKSRLLRSLMAPALKNLRRWRIPQWRPIDQLEKEHKGWFAKCAERGIELRTEARYFTGEIPSCEALLSSFVGASLTAFFFCFDFRRRPGKHLLS
jgi:hypothetical protein